MNISDGPDLRWTTPLGLGGAAGGAFLGGCGGSVDATIVRGREKAYTTSVAVTSIIR
jgi:hypothetical protein